MKALLLSTLVFLSAVCSAQSGKGDSWAQVKSKGSGVLGVVYYEQPGLIYKADDGQIKGVCVDILADFSKYVEKQYGKKVNIQYVAREPEFSNFLKTSTTTQNVVGVSNVSITEERKKTMQFTPPFMTTELALLTHKSAPTIRNLSELSTVFNGFTAQVITGTTHVKYIENIKKQYYPELKVTYAPSSEDVIKNLTSNTKMFSILDFTEYIGVVRKKIPLKRQEIELGNPEPLGFVMSKQTDWGPLFQEFLTEEYRKSVRYKQIIADNLGSSFLSLVR